MYNKQCWLVIICCWDNILTVLTFLFLNTSSFSLVVPLPRFFPRIKSYGNFTAFQVLAIR